MLHVVFIRIFIKTLGGEGFCFKFSQEEQESTRKIAVWKNFKQNSFA